jgi:hypothetical protein
VFQALHELRGLEMDVEGAAFETKPGDRLQRLLARGLDQPNDLAKRFVVSSASRQVCGMGM